MEPDAQWPVGLLGGEGIKAEFLAQTPALVFRFEFFNSLLPLVPEASGSSHTSTWNGVSLRIKKDDLASGINEP
jgi:hypothetical protein